MAKEIKFKCIGRYNGHSIKANNSVDLGFVFPYDEMVNYIKLLQLLNENITIYVRLGSNSPVKLGMFMLRGLNIDHDGEGMGKFNSQFDYIEANNLNGLAKETLTILFKANVEDAEEDDDED